MGKRASLCFTPGEFSLPKKQPDDINACWSNEQGNGPYERATILPTKCRETPKRTPLAGGLSGCMGWFTPNATFRVRIAAAVVIAKAFTERIGMIINCRPCLVTSGEREREPARLIVTIKVSFRPNIRPCGKPSLVNAGLMMDKFRRRDFHGYDKRNEREWITEATNSMIAHMDLDSDRPITRLKFAENLRSAVQVENQPLLPS